MLTSKRQVDFAILNSQVHLLSTNSLVLHVASDNLVGETSRSGCVVCTPRLTRRRVLVALLVFVGINCGLLCRA
jgi:hypothetical protein